MHRVGSGNAASEGSEESEKCDWKLEVKNPYYVLAESLVKLCLAVMQKVEIVNDNLGHLAEESLNLSVKGAACFHRAVYRKM